ncbi:MAG: hypothetical protein HY799_10935 [Nitrosomonadales bacterium]|nr:hypothetical protein [Nitrosomonadales bacterium]
MIRLDKALLAWGTPDFEAVLKQEIARKGADMLPLQQGLSHSNHVSDAPVTVVIKEVVELDGTIRVRAGILYQGIISGCSCADDPTPDSEINENCEVLLDIDRSTAATAVALITDTSD